MELEVWSENGCGKSEIGSGFGEPGGSPPPRISRSTPPPPGQYPEGVGPLNGGSSVQNTYGVQRMIHLQASS